MPVAESYVWQYANGTGYVGRSPQGSARKVARPGELLTEDAVKALGLSDLKDRTDYAAGLAAAAEAGANVTVRKEATKGTGKNARKVTIVASVPASEVA